MKGLMQFLNNHLYKFIIIFLLLLTSFIYIYKIDLLSLDCDEIFTINIANLPELYDVIHEGNIEDTHPPLYHFLLFFFVKVFGVTEFSIRLFSAFCGILSIYFIFVLSRKMFSVNEGVISSLLLAFNTYILYINQNARDYALFLLLSILTFIFLVNIMRNIDKQNPVLDKDVLLYILFSTLNLYTHYFALFLLANQLFLLLIFYGKKSIKYLLFIIFVTFSLFAPWIQFIVRRGVGTFDMNYLQWLKKCVLFDYEYDIVLKLFLTIPIVFILGNKIFKKESFKTVFFKYKYEIFLLFFAVVPYFLLFVIDRYMIKCYADRYIVFLIIIYTVLIARGITLLFKNFVLQFAVVFVLFISLTFGVFNYKVNSVSEFYCDNPKGAIQCMSLIYKLNRNKDINFLFVGVHFFDYYIHKYLDNVETDKITIIDWRKCQVDKDIISFLEQKQPQYVLTLQSCHTTYLQDNYEVVFTEHFNYFDVFLIKIK